MSLYSSSVFSFSTNHLTCIGITGGTGSGKTTLARALHQSFDPEHAVLLHTDDYYRDWSHLPVDARKRVNFDHPDSCDTPLLISHLHVLAAGHAIEVPRYDFTTHTRLAETTPVPATSVIILEGLLAFADPTVRRLLSLLVFMETPDDVRFIRRLRRDVRDRGRTMDAVVEQYLATVRPMHQAVVEPIRPLAHVVVSGEWPMARAVDTVRSRLEGSPRPVAAVATERRQRT